MTDKESLIAYRLKQANETLSDAKKMLQAEVSLRSVVNRAYYAVFYSVLALFLKADINVKTSKHSGVISVFDKELVHTGKIEKHYSKILHRIFDYRQIADYKEFVEILPEDAEKHIKLAEEFLEAIRRFINKE